MNIYEKIEKIAKQKGYSIAALEKECGFGNGLIKKWTTSKPSFDKLQKVADTLKVNVNYFSSKTDKSNNKNEKAVSDNLIEDVRPDIIVPDVLHQVGIGFHKGEKSLTQDDINDIALIIEMKLNKRNAENEDK